MEFLDTLWVVVCAIIVLDMQAGFLALEAGVVRTKNAANVALKNISDVCLVAGLFWLFGYALMFGPSWEGLIGLGSFAPNIPEMSGEKAGFLLFQLAFAATAATIVSGAVAERERYEGYMLLSVTMACCVYPIVGHWIWNGANTGELTGWLGALGFVDFAGATAVHAVGGWAALAAILVLGARLGRFSSRNRRFEEHSVALTALGTILLWIGWGAFNGGSALVFDESVPAVVGLTMLTAVGGGLASIFLSFAVFGYGRIDLILNGVLAGLVAGTAGVNLFSAPAAVGIGALGALAMAICTELLRAVKVDDVVGAVPVHLAAGLTGSLAVPFLAPVDALPAGGVWAQFGVQLTGNAAVGAWVFCAIGAVALVLRKSGLLRARPRDELTGLNLAENRSRNAFLDLLEDMRKHQRSGVVGTRARVERSTEVGALALRYNAVLDRVEDEIMRRMDAMRAERQMRTVAEDAFEAMRKAQEESAWAARHDPLTGLGNRMFLDELSGSPAGEDEAQLLAIAIDMDRFKDVNDSYGHEAGDLVLTATARRLRERVRSGRDFAFRIGGDEFVLLVDFDGNAATAQFFCDELVDSIVEPTRYRGAELRVGASVGFARVNTDEVLGEALKRADLALYQAKSEGRNRAVAYTASMTAVHDERVELLEDFKRALQRGEITAHFQPQVDAQTRHLVGCEALARWEHPTRGTLSPNVFVPLAEELRMLAEVDAHVLDLALQARTNMLDALGYTPEVSVNVSASRLGKPDLLEELKARDDLPKQGLSFEILETAYLDTVSEQLEATVTGLKAQGIRVEVDDFGTGHASLASVLALKPDRLKIDRMFVPGVDKDTARRDLMRGLVEMAKKVGAETVVEGVETHSEAQALADLGADVLQGFAFARPMAFEDLVDWAQSHVEQIAKAG